MEPYSLTILQWHIIVYTDVPENTKVTILPLSFLGAHLPNMVWHVGKIPPWLNPCKILQPITPLEPKNLAADGIRVVANAFIVIAMNRIHLEP